MRIPVIPIDELLHDLGNSTPPSGGAPSPDGWPLSGLSIDWQRAGLAVSGIICLLVMLSVRTSAVISCIIALAVIGLILLSTRFLEEIATASPWLKAPALVLILAGLASIAIAAAGLVVVGIGIIIGLAVLAGLGSNN